MADFNSMQANLGLIPGVGAPSQTIKSPSSIASQLSQQATQQLQQAEQQLPVAMGGGAAFSFGQQFQQQLHQIQSQQSMNIYQAAMVAGAMPQGGPGGMMPSPLTMTPPSTGIFRPQAQAPSYAPVAPMPVMPMARTPFQPQMPAPMFKTSWEQEVQQRELRADKLYSYSAQTPRALGQGAGIGLGALAGGMLGSRFGGVGRAIGAMAGAGLSQMSGVAPAMGNMAMMGMRPGIEQHQMGASLQRMSQDWVVGGSQLHATGRGFSRGGSLELAGGLQQMASSNSFQQETGGMFNRHDLMKMTQQSGQRGLLDEAQNVDGVKQQMRQVSQVVRRFMELTNDPDVTNVIRQMGQMRQMGLSVPDMDKAASNMRQFSRAAGTTIQGMQQTYGMPGAATYQQAGLSAGAGMNYGMYSGAAARQAVASQTFSPMQLSMLGGTQGVAQRNMQAQAAMMSMPIMGAAMGSFQGGQWGADYGAMAGMMGGGQGAQGAVNGAIGNINSAVQQGGIGALAMFPLQQRMIQSQAAGSMNPYEQTAMRFQMAQSTGEGLGMKGAGAFAVGAQAMFGKEVAEQMMLEASNPEYWRAQRAMIKRERDELSRTQRQEIKENAPGFFSSLLGGPMGSVSRAVSATGEAVASPFKAAGEGISSAYQAFSNYKDDLSAKSEGRAIQRIDKRFTTGSIAERKAQAFRAQGITSDQVKNVLGTAKDGVDYGQFSSDFSETFEGTRLSQYSGMNEMMEWGAAAIDMTPVGWVGMALGLDTAEMAKSGVGALLHGAMTPEAREAVTKRAQKRGAPSRAMIQQSKGYSALSADSGKAFSNLESKFDLKVSGYSVMGQASGAVARSADAAKGFQGADKKVTAESVDAHIIHAISQNSGKSRREVQKIYEGMSADERTQLKSMAFGGAHMQASDTGKDMLLQTEEYFEGGAARRSIADMENLVEGAKSSLEDTEDKLDFENWAGSGRAGRDEIRDITKIAKTSEMMMMVQHQTKDSAGMETKVKDQIRAEAKAQGITLSKKDLDKKYIEMSERVRGGRFEFGKGKMITDDVRERVLGAIDEQGADKAMDLMKEYSVETTKTIKALQISKAGRGLEEELNMPVNMQNLLSIGEKNIQKMQQSGEFGTVGNLLADAKSAKTPEERRRLEAKAFKELSRVGGQITETEEIDLYGAQGDDARKLTNAGKTLAQTETRFSEVFKNFNESSTKNFKDGAEALLNAMGTRRAANQNAGKIGE